MSAVFDCYNKQFMKEFDKLKDYLCKNKESSEILRRHNICKELCVLIENKPFNKLVKQTSKFNEFCIFVFCFICIQSNFKFKIKKYCGYIIFQTEGNKKLFVSNQFYNLKFSGLDNITIFRKIKDYLRSYEEFDAYLYYVLTCFNVELLIGLVKNISIEFKYESDEFDKLIEIQKSLDDTFFFKSLLDIANHEAEKFTWKFCANFCIKKNII